MLRLYMIMVPGLEVKSDWRIVHDRLLDDFPKIDDVLPTTTPETLLIVYRGRAHVDEWVDAANEGVLLHRRFLDRRRRRIPAVPRRAPNYDDSRAPPTLNHQSYRNGVIHK
jgi:hypothetical protein